MGDQVKIGLIGHGQVGGSIAQCYQEFNRTIAITDGPKGFADDLSACEVIHVSIPPEVIAEVLPHKRALYLVHSTVPVGFCRQLYTQGYKIVHCPVEGRHPDIHRSLYYWKMPLGGPAEFKGIAAAVLGQVGIIADPQFGDWEETELAKLFSTTWVGIEVAIMRHAYELAAQFGVSGERVYQLYNASYNQLYAEGPEQPFDPHRPSLKPMDGPLGGHCVGPNADLLLQSGPSWMAAMVQKMARENWRNPCA